MTDAPFIPGGIPEFLVELDVQIRMLEGMLGDPGLINLRMTEPTHPAIERHDRLNRLAARSAEYDASQELETVLQLISGFLDRTTWLPVTVPLTFWDIIPDAAARDFAKRRIREPGFFFDVLAELHWWGWLSKKVRCKIGETESMPDLEIEHDGKTIWADVKNIHVGTRPRQAADVANKANSQIKRANANAVGAVLIHIDRAGRRASFDDRIPNDVQPYVDELRGALHPGQLRSIGHAVLTWDDYFILSEPDRPAMYAVRRRSLVLRHPQPRGEPAVPNEFWDLGFTGVVLSRQAHSQASARSRAPEIRGSGWRVTQLFRAENEFGDGIRPDHAREALEDPDGIATYELDDLQLTLSTRRVDLGRLPYILLVLTTQQPSQPTDINMAFKLTASVGSLPGLAADPNLSFRYLLEHFGMPVQVGRQVGLFVPYEFVPRNGPATELVRVLRDAPMTLWQILKTVTDPRPGVEIRWAFAIDRQKYRGSLR